jgi:hypothetical protein
LLILTANYRGFDRDVPNVPGIVVYDERRRDNGTLEGRWLGKAPKCAPHLLGHKERDIIWVDASMRFRAGSPGPTNEHGYLKSLVEQVPEGGVGLFRHRHRDCIYTEATHSLTMPIYKRQPIVQQVRHYQREGHPQGWGLWECGIIVWRGAQHHIGERWLAEQLAWSSQDQISLPFVLRELGQKVTDLSPGSVVDNPWFRYQEHGT